MFRSYQSWSVCSSLSTSQETVCKQKHTHERESLRKHLFRASHLKDTELYASSLIMCCCDRCTPTGVFVLASLSCCIFSCSVSVQRSYHQRATVALLWTRAFSNQRRPAVTTAGGHSEKGKKKQDMLHGNLTLRAKEENGDAAGDNLCLGSSRPFSFTTFNQLLILWICTSCLTNWFKYTHFLWHSELFRCLETTNTHTRRQVLRLTAISASVPYFNLPRFLHFNGLNIVV